MSQWFGHGVTFFLLLLGLHNSNYWNGFKCGRGLAPDSGGSVSIAVTDVPPSGASPLPHWIFIAHKVLFTTVHCQLQICSIVQPELFILFKLEHAFEPIPL
ncbi:hypothetical protein IFU06_09405 [Pseudomonas fluorescens]|nr:hypothetical protein [Pseudomonas fluorescens]